MPLGVTMVDLRRDLRAETGQSLNPSQGVQSQQTQDNQLDRQQRELWDAYDWPHLRYFTSLPIEAGENIFQYPNDMPFDQINRVFWAATGETQWHPMTFGLRAYDLNPIPAEQVSGTPVRWGNRAVVEGGVTNPTGVMLIVPTPTSAGKLLFEGQAPCTNLVADGDKCIIDSKAIVLFAASEILATAKAEVAQFKLGKANNHLRKLLSNNGAEKRRNYNMGGVYRSYGGPVADRRHAVPYIDYIP
jgi:hypothetical protein